MAQAVVDDLETVEVQEQDAHLAAVAPHAVKRSLKAVVHKGPVGKPGERVQQSKTLELGLRGLSFGEVPDKGAKGYPFNRRRAVRGPSRVGLQGSVPCWRDGLVRRVEAVA